MKNVKNYLFHNAADTKFLNNLRKSLHHLNYDVTELDMLLLENLNTKAVIRRTVFFMSENIRESKMNIPICYLILTHALKDTNLKQAVFEPDSTKHIKQFIENIIKYTVSMFSLEVQSSRLNWNIEDAIYSRDLLFSHLLTNAEGVKIEKYEIKDMDRFQQEMYRYLAPFLFKTEENSEVFHKIKNFSTKTAPVIETPIFSFVED